MSSILPSLPHPALLLGPQDTFWKSCGEWSLAPSESSRLFPRPSPLHPSSVLPPTEPSLVRFRSHCHGNDTDEKSFGDWWTWEQIPALSLSLLGCVALGKFWNISESVA